VLITRYSFLDLDRDFVYFYSEGKLLKEHPPEQLYDFRVQREVDNEVRSIGESGYGPSPYPPYVALFFRSFAALPFGAAYHLWMLVTFCLYVSGAWLLSRTFFPDRLDQAAWVCGSLLFWPFLGNTLLNGQLSAVGFFSIGSALCAQHARRPYWSGLALSLSLYKPTLLIWLIPLLLVGRAWRTLASFFSVALVLFSITTVTLGPQIWIGYAKMTASLGEWQRYLHQEDHVDILGMFALATGRTPGVGGLICLFLGGLWIVFIWAYVLRHRAHNSLVVAWALTLPTALLVNLYSPVYDSILLIPSLIVCARLIPGMLGFWPLMGCLVILATSYCSTWIAVLYHVQLIGISLIAVSAIQMWKLHQSWLEFDGERDVDGAA